MARIKQRHNVVRSVGIHCIQFSTNPCFPVVAVVAVDEVDDSARDVIEVEDGRVSVQAGSVELVTILHGQLSEGSKVPLPDGTDHLLHPTRDDTVCTILEDRHRGERNITCIVLLYKSHLKVNVNTCFQFICQCELLSIYE